MIQLISLCYTLSWSRHHNVATLVQLGVKEMIGPFVFPRLLLRCLVLLQYYAGHDIVINDVLALWCDNGHS